MNQHITFTAHFRVVSYLIPPSSVGECAVLFSNEPVQNQHRTYSAHFLGSSYLRSLLCREECADLFWGV